ncbi:MAG: MltA domain-containing protein [Elusimicrobia bacterium]|nr:MltA domain-containing protein [Elusimicrobiota bacterium]
MKSAFRAVPLLVLAGCLPPSHPVSLPPPPPPPPPALVPFEAVAPEDWPELSDDLDAETFARAAARSKAYLDGQDDKLWSIGPVQVGTQTLIETLDALAQARKDSAGPKEFTDRLKAGFELYRVRGSTTGPGAHYSSYYPPTLAASRKQTPEFKYPLFGRPKDLVEVDLGSFDPKWKGEKLFGRIASSGSFVPYFDRRDFDVRGQLAGRGLEAAWLKDPFDRLNIHIQGSGLLSFQDGTMAMARFAATNGRPYQSVGLAVVGAGAMTRDQITAATLKQYLAEHPEGEAWLLARNPRYTFFELVDLPADGEPPGTIGQALVAGRSIAVDPSVVPLGAACWVSVPVPQADAQGRLLAREPMRRLMLAQDTGGAIKGPGRVDLYMGHGPEAETVAHRVWDAGELFVLVLKRPARSR